MRCRTILILFAAVCGTGGTFPGYHALLHAQILQRDTLTRDHEPVILEGHQLGLLSTYCILNEFIFCYAYSDSGWNQVLLQIDERDNENNDYFTPDQINDRMDDNDELVFMACEAGHRVARTEWVAGADSTYRYEVEIIDGMDPGRKAWVYFFISSELEKNTELDYVSYSGMTTQIVESEAYVQDTHDEMPLVMVDLIIKENWGGGDEDFMDRMKMRTKLFSWTPATTEEDVDVDWKHVIPIDGQVRVIIRFWTTFAGIIDMARVTSFSYRSLNVIHTHMFKGFFPVTIYSVKQHYDWDYRESGMIHYDDGGNDPDYNKDIINGDGGGNPEIREPIMNWYETNSPDLGAFIVIMDTSSIPADRYYRYYSDAGYVGEENDTGDGWQWGESGYELINVSNRKASDTYAWSFNMPGRAEEEGPWGPELLPLYLHPMEVAIECQEYESQEIIAAFSHFDVSWQKDGSILLTWRFRGGSVTVDIYRSHSTGDISLRNRVATVTGKSRWIDRDPGTGRSPQYWIAPHGEENPAKWAGPLRARDTLNSNRAAESLAVSPNPCNPETRIRYYIGAHEIASPAALHIHNQTGKAVCTLCSKNHVSTGWHSVTWDGRNNAGAQVSSGIYIVRLSCGKRTEYRKIIVLR
jgi:hypothetical protein